MGQILQTVISLSISGSILTLILFVINRLVKERLTKSFQYYIWLIVLVRLLLPVTFEMNLLNNVFSETSTHVTQDIVSEYLGVQQTQKPQKNNQKIKLNSTNVDKNTGSYLKIQSSYIENVGRFLQMDVVQNIWLFGVGISLAVSVIGYTRFVSYVRGSAKLTTFQENEILKRVASTRNINRRITMFRSPYVATPMLIGLFHPQIILPSQSFTDDQLENILHHELTHLKRIDIGVKWLITLVTSLHWFNPIIYLVRREMNTACELSCDEAVIQGLDQKGKQNYGSTLLSVVSTSRLPAGAMSITMCEEKRILKERLESIMRYKRKTSVTKFLSAALCIVVMLIAVVLGACEIKPTAKNKSSKKTVAEVKPDAGKIDGNEYTWKYQGEGKVYTNPFFKMKIEFPEKWSILPKNTILGSLGEEFDQNKFYLFSSTPTLKIEQQPAQMFFITSERNVKDPLVYMNDFRQELIDNSKITVIGEGVTDPYPYKPRASETKKVSINGNEYYGFGFSFDGDTPEQDILFYLCKKGDYFLWFKFIKTDQSGAENTLSYVHFN